MALKQTNLVFKTGHGNSREEALEFYKNTSQSVLFTETGWSKKYDPNSDYIVHWEDDSDEDVDVELWFIYKLS